MKKLFLLSLAGLTVLSVYSQQFTLITDTGNPIVSDSPNSAYYGQAYTGCAWVDIDHDDDLDLFHSGNLYANQGNGVFRKYTGIGGQAGQASISSCSWGDFNMDGHIDLLYKNNNKTSVYLNDGQGGLFIYQTYLETIQSTCWSAQFCDFNNDSWLDITLTFANGFSAGNFPVRLYSGSDRGLYPISDTLEFLNDLHPYTVSYFTDYDQDGDQDLFIASGPGGTSGPDFHYRNLLVEKDTAIFEKITDQPFAGQLQDGQNYNFIDYDNDGDLDMCLTNWGGAANRFYRNDDGNYVEVSTAFTTGGVCLSNAWGDFDSDSYIDVIITAGGSGDHAGYYRNNGNGTFDFKGNIIKDNINGNSAGISLGDYDNDGDLDFFTVGMEKGLFRNEMGEHNSWINIALTGVDSNTAALGARIRVKAAIRGNEVWQVREVSAQNTFMGHNSLRAHFGLSNALKVDSLIIYWPSGLEEVYTDLEVRDFHKFTEGESIVSGVAQIKKKNDLIKLYPNPVIDELQVEFLTQDFLDYEMNITDSAGRKVMSKTVNGKSLIQIPTIELRPGLYYIRIKNEKHYFSESFIVAR